MLYSWCRLNGGRNRIFSFTVGYGQFFSKFDVYTQAETPGGS